MFIELLFSGLRNFAYIQYFIIKCVFFLESPVRSPGQLSATDASLLTEQLIPIEMWGKTYCVAAFPGRSVPSLLKFVAKEDATKVGPNKI